MTLLALSDKLMIVAGGDDFGFSSDVEIIDMSGQQRNCFKPLSYPTSWKELYGSYFNGLPIVCGGHGGSEDEPEKAPVPVGVEHVARNEEHSVLPAMREETVEQNHHREENPERVAVEEHQGLPVAGT